MKHWLPLAALIVSLIVVMYQALDEEYQEPHVCPLMTKRELQERLGVEVDGDIGEKTLEAWDKAICDQHGMKDYEGTFK